MNVLVVSDYYLPHWTGIAKSLSYLLSTIKKNHEVTVLTTRFDKTLPIRETVQGVPVRRLPYWFSVSRAKYNPFFWVAAIAYISRSDTVLVNSPSAHIFPLALVVKLLGKRLVVLHQGDLILPKGLVNKLVERIFDLVTLLSFFLADSLATFNLDYAAHSRVLKPFLGKCTSFIPPVPTIKRKDPGMERRLKELKKKYRVFFGFGGRFVEEKGFDILLQAIPRVVAEIPSAHFVYAGKSDMEYEHFYAKTKHLLEPVREHVTELGLLDTQKLASFYSLIDIVVVPSRSDCFPYFQAEAMAEGTPSVVADIPGARYLVLKSSFGYTFTPEDPEDLSPTLVRAYRHLNELKKAYPRLKVLLDPVPNEKKIREFIGE